MQGVFGQIVLGILILPLVGLFSIMGINALRSFKDNPNLKNRRSLLGGIMYLGIALVFLYMSLYVLSGIFRGG